MTLSRIMTLNPEETRILENYAGAICDLHLHLRNVGRFPTEGQASPIRALFNDDKKIIMGQCGRSFGKTELILYMAWRWALTHPCSEIYIICPQRAQAKKIYWYKKRLQNYGPQKYVAEHRESELRTVFRNGSYIVLDGCENFEALRGIKPSLVIYDEFQHHTSSFDEEVMQPNLASGTPLVVMGTPPKTDCYYVEFRNNLLEAIKGGDASRHYLELPTWYNPTQDRVWLEGKRQELLRRKRYNVWLREYEGKLVFDTDSAVFPTFSRGEHVYPASFIDNLILRDKSKLQWFAIFDPGTTTCFAVLFACINPYTSQVFILDEIYEKRREFTKALTIWDLANKIKAKYYKASEWRNIYDEAAAWFANEIIAHTQEAVSPTHKGRHKTKDGTKPGESIIKTLMDTKYRFFVSEKCHNFIWELENYVTNDKGEYPVKNDHLIDDLHYLVTESFFVMLEEPEEKEEIDEAEERDYTVQEGIGEWDKGDSSVWDMEGNEDIWIN